MKKIIGKKQLLNEIKEKGVWNTFNLRGENKFIGPIIYTNEDNFENNPDFTSKHKETIENELNDFIGQVPFEKCKNKKWWKNDEELYNQYLLLFKDFYKVVNKIKKYSRNAVLTNSNSCLSYINFYFTKPYAGEDFFCLNILAVQRSGDASLGIAYDNYLLKLLHNKVSYLTGVNNTLGEITHIIVNAHIYKENIYLDKPIKKVRQNKERNN